MKRSIVCLIPLCLMIQSGCLADKEKLYGSWQVESSTKDFPEGTVIEFTREGKVRMGVINVLFESQMGLSERGTFEVSGNSITFTTGQKSATWRIVELSENKLVIKVDDSVIDATFKKRRS